MCPLSGESIYTTVDCIYVIFKWTTMDTGTANTNSSISILFTDSKDIPEMFPENSVAWHLHFAATT